MQIAISIRYTNGENVIPEENLIAMIEAQSSTGEALLDIILDVLQQLGLDLSNLVCKGYDIIFHLSCA